MEWPTAALSEVANIISGGTPKSGVAEYWEGDVEWITPKDMGKMSGIYASDTIRKISQVGLNKSSAKLISENSVILSTRAPIGHLAINTVPMATNQGCRGLEPKDNLDTKYLYYFLLKSVDLLNDLGSGTTFKELSKGALEKVNLPLPPIPEQKRIVAILDQAFAGIEQARAKTEQNLKNARELFESSLKGIFQSRGKDWERVSLLELLERKWITGHLDGNHGGDYPLKSEFVDSGVPYISAKCLVDGELDMSKAKYLTAERAGSLRKGIAKNEDVLFAHNATVGPVTILETDEEKVILGTSLTYYRCDKEFILPNYLAQYMVSYEFTSQYTSIMRQSTRNQVPITKQREFIHVIPPVDEQADIASSLVELSDQLKKLEQIYKAKLAALDELKKSILQKAFSGELTKTLNGETSKGAAA